MIVKRNTLVILAVGLLLAPTIAAYSQEYSQDKRSPSDAEITARVKTAMIRNDETKARQINVDTERGIVQLSGFVASNDQKHQAERITRQVAGVTEVRNDIAMEPLQ